MAEKTEQELTDRLRENVKNHPDFPLQDIHYQVNSILVLYRASKSDSVDGVFLRGPKINREGGLAILTVAAEMEKDPEKKQKIEADRKYWAENYSGIERVVYRQ
jgi:hypothetical protein